MLYFFMRPQSQISIIISNLSTTDSINLLRHQNQKSPKHLGYGIASGISNIVSGAVGAVGIVVLAPVLGTAVGAKEGGIVGGTVGLVGGEI